MPSIDAFDLSRCTPLQHTIVAGAVQRCTFDFTRLAPKLRAEQGGRTTIPVEWADLSRFGMVTADAVPVNSPAPETRRHGDDDHGDARRATLGLAYYSGRIVIEQSLVSDPALAEVVFLSEAAHMVDFFWLTDAQRRRLFELFHEPGQDPDNHGHGWFEETGNQDYWSWAGESWMTGFIHATTELRPDWGRFVHRFTDDDIREVQALLEVGPSAPAAEPVCAARFGYAYHRPGAHWWVLCPRRFPDRHAAEAAGLRACRWCEP